MLSQLLFMAGNSLTVGGFFNYFVVQFHPSAFLMAAAMIAPETAQSFSVLGRWIAIRSHCRKRNWIRFLIAGRIASMLLPLALFWPPAREANLPPLMLILICTAVWYLFQGIAYVNYLSWLSVLVPEVNWGRLLSRRQLAGLLVSLGMPLLTVWLRQVLLKGQPGDVVRWSYSLLFIAGGLITLASILPLVRFPEISERRFPERTPVPFSQLTFSRSFQCLLAARWWLAFFQGLTQAVLFKYAVEILDVSLPAYTVLTSLMIALQMPMVWWAGRCSDRFQEKRALFWGMAGLSCALPFWIFATPERWWLIAVAYAIWGGFGLINVCGQSLCLKLAPIEDNVAHLAFYEQISGLIAGAAGLLGGYCLDQFQRGEWLWAPAFLSPVMVLLIVSWMGRLTAPLWLIPIQQPVRELSSGQ